MHDVGQVVVESIAKARSTWIPDKEWNYASSAGATCARELGYWRTRPQDAMRGIDAGLAVLFAHGHWVEKEAVAQLEGAGYEITERDSAFRDDHFRVRGRIDGKIRLDGAKRPVEVKGYHPSSWARLNRIEDFLESDKEYLRKVPAQLLLYMLMDGTRGSELGILYLMDKSSGRPKTIPLALEGDTLDWGEALLKKLETVNGAVAAAELPPRITYEESVCGVCPFRHICLTELPAGAAPEVLDPETNERLLDLLTRWDELDPLRKEFKRVDEEISEIVKGREKIILGDFVVTGKEVSQERVDTKAMPAEVRARYAKPTTYWRKSIATMKPVAEDEE